MRKKGIFKYIDKDKILPWLKERRGCSIDTEYLVDMINNGFFDWQQGSE